MFAIKDLDKKWQIHKIENIECIYESHVYDYKSEAVPVVIISMSNGSIVKTYDKIEKVLEATKIPKEILEQ